MIAATTPRSSLGINTLRILVLEDDKDQRLALEELLQQTLHQIRVVESGMTAKYVVDTEDFDFALLDVMTPDMDGFNAARTLLRKGTPFVIMSGLSQKDIETYFLKESIPLVCYLSKPFTPTALFGKIDEILKG